MHTNQDYLTHVLTSDRKSSIHNMYREIQEIKKPINKHATNRDIEDDGLNRLELELEYHRAAVKVGRVLGFLFCQKCDE